MDRRESWVHGPLVPHAELMTADGAVELVVEGRERPVGDGTVRRLLPWRRRRMVGPFIFCDLIGPESVGPGRAMNVDAHPHIGLSTLTYLLAGRVVHRDSTGAVQTIAPGAVNWMTAGSGVTHTERSHPDEVRATGELWGVQTWVALPDDAQDGPARFEHCPTDEVPVERHGATEVAVAAGRAFGSSAPITGSSPLALVEIRLHDSALRVPADHPERALSVLDGECRLDGSPLVAGTLAVLRPGSRPELTGTGTVVELAGEPVGERHIWWNFVHRDPDRIEQAKDDWRAQAFPVVPGDHDGFVPLPE